ncbi:hypothetical protein [Acetonema longum]|uniref:Uncharacterized protein n=1 Tax=Acetonema longum DSM 6540 TaxID=1009370 RepID=F7NIX3_9FIRM|nr:hypothetical protein [Acetonema longum]EGO63970.1 hypothetical protein ALO_10129 [Acetonema longum DSM 6540]
MSRIIAVQSDLARTVTLLQQKGYKVIDMYEAQKPGASPAACLYTSYHPDRNSGYHNGRDLWDIQLGGSGASPEGLVSAISLNITGMSPEAAVAALEYQLCLHRGSR